MTRQWKRVLIFFLFILFFSTGAISATDESTINVNDYIDDSGMLNVNLEDVDLKEFIRTMSVLLEKNFVVDSKMKGTVSIISPEPVSREMAFSILESVLDVNGLQMVKASQGGEIYKIVQSVLSKTEGLDTTVGLSVDKTLPSDKMITQVIPVRYIAARDILTMFQPLVSKQGYMVTHEPSNTIILTDRVSNVQRLSKILRNIDVKGSQSQIYSFVLRYADVTEMAKGLSTLFNSPSSGAGISSARTKTKTLPYNPPGGPTSSGRDTLLVPDERTNTLLAMCGPEEYIKLNELIQILDVPTPRVRDRIHVYYLNYANAEEVAEVLNKQATRQNTTSRNPTRREPVAESLLEGVNINADKSTNSLVITSSPEDFDVLSKVISKLDIPRAQVLVEALIIETTLDLTHEIGVEWRNTDAPKEDSLSAFGGTNLPIGTEETGSLNKVAADANPYSANMPSGLILGVIKGPVYWGKNAFYTVGALARALRANTDVNILLSPHILTYDNQESEIIVGEERPYLKSSQTSTEGSVIRSFEFKDVGTTLRLTPHISQNDMIRFDIFAEIKNFVEQIDVGAITTTKRHINTSVQVENGKTVVLGGIIKEDVRKSESMVPCLGQIWGLGWLFKSQKKQNSKTNLLIFINPHIVREGADLEAITRKKREEFDEKTEQSFHSVLGEPIDGAIEETKTREVIDESTVSAETGQSSDSNESVSEVKE